MKLFIIGIPESPHILNRAGIFRTHGHDVTVFSRFGSAGPANTVFKTFPPARVCQNYLSAVKLYFELRTRNPDIIHVHYAYSPLAWLLPLLTNKPIVVSVMGGDILFDEQGNPTVFGKKLTINLLKRSDLITSKSDYLTSYLNRIDAGLTKKTKRVIWGVDLAKFKPVDANKLKKKLRLKDKDFVLLSPRSIRPIYNIKLIIEALPEIIDNFPNTKLVITEFKSEKNYKMKIMDLIAKLGLNEHVIFVGQIQHDDMVKYYSLADISLAVPSSDGIPQSLLEAMACEVPNIVSNLPCYQEIVQHGESVHFTKLDSRSIANSVLHLMKKPELRNRIVHNAKEIVDAKANFNLDVKRVEAAYYNLISSPSTKQSSVKLKAKILIFILFYFVELFIRKTRLIRN